MLQDASGFRQLSVNENHLDASPSRQASVFSNIVEIDERFSQNRVMPLDGVKAESSDIDIPG
jgi:hypothetical protein